MQVAARRPLEALQQVGQLRAAVGVPGEVVAGPCEEPVLTDVGHQLLEHRRALGVGDAVEVLPRRLQVVHGGDDGVRGGQLVGAVGPGLAPGGERRPHAVELGGGLGDVVAHQVGERLLEPGAVPPARGHQVAEPHVGHLVQDHLGPTRPVRARRRAAVDEALGEGDQARVLHRAEVVLGHEDRVVLAPGVGVPERAVVEVQALPGDGEDRLRVEVFGHRRPAQHPERHVPPDVGDAVVRPGGERGQVGGLWRRRAERHGHRAVGGRPGRLGLPGDDLPALRRGDDERAARLEIGLLEVREHPAGVGGLEVGVEVGGAVGGIDESVQPLAGAAVAALGLDDQLVRAVGGGYRQPGAVVPGDVELAAVDPRGAHPVGDQVDPGGSTGEGAGEGDSAARRERGGGRVRGPAQVELDAVARDGQRRRAGAALGVGQVGGGGGHPLILPAPAPVPPSRRRTGAGSRRRRR